MKEAALIVKYCVRREECSSNCLRMNVSATVYKIVKIYITRWS